MILILLGSQKFQFNRLLKAIDEQVKSEEIQDEEIIAQIGHSDYIPKNYKYKRFIDRDKLIEYICKADVIICHGGTGVIINSLKKGKKVIAIPRLSEFNEHVDNHQEEIIDKFSNENYLIGLKDLNKLHNVIIKIKNMKLKRFISNTGHFVSIIENIIEKQ